MSLNGRLPGGLRRDAAGTIPRAQLAGPVGPGCHRPCSSSSASSSGGVSTSSTSTSSWPTPTARHGTPMPSAMRPHAAPCGPTRMCVRAHGQARNSSLHLPVDRDLEEPLEGFDRIADALADFAAGKFLVVLDDESRENEGDLIIAADLVTTEAMAFMVEHTSGVVCVGMEGADLDRLRLPLMVTSAENEEAMYTAFTVTVDIRDGITTGISAADRTATLRKLADPHARPEQLRRPGHIFPLRSRAGGVLVRPGHTEAGVDLARLAGRFPAGALCEIVNKPDGSMARTPELLAFARTHGLRCIAIADLMRYRLRHEQLVTRAASAPAALMPPPASTAAAAGGHHTPAARVSPLHVHAYRSAIDGAEHVAVVAGDVAGQHDVAVHVQLASNITELLGLVPSASPLAAAATSTSRGSGSGPATAEDALARVAASGCGVLVLLQRPPSEGPCSMVDAVKRLAMSAQSTAAGASLDLCDYGVAAQILSDLQVRSVQLLADSAEQRMSLGSCGVSVGAGVAGQPGSSNGVALSNGHVRAPAHAGQV